MNGVLPGVNFGSVPFLQISAGTKTYIKFDLSSLPAATVAADIAKVNLVL